MDKYLKKYREWFESRNLREKLLVSAASWATLYALFSLILFRPIDNTSADYAAVIKKNNDQLVNWQTQLKFLKEIPKTPLYKEWIQRHQNYEALKSKYRNLLGDPNDKNWDNILKTVLSDYPNIIINTVHHSPETAYQTTKTKAEPDSILQQQLDLGVVGGFQDIVGYLQYLEKTLPNIHWNTLTYEVKRYPLADVTMEFSVLYEKPAQ